MEDNKTTITINSYDRELIVSIPNDSNIDEIMESVTKMVAFFYSEENVNHWIVERADELNERE
jgi:hypothetical protein